MVNELFLLLLRNFGITYLRILNLQTQLMILNANLKHFFLCELMNRDVFICYLIFYLLYAFIYFVVSLYVLMSISRDYFYFLVLSNFSKQRL